MHDPERPAYVPTSRLAAPLCERVPTLGGPSAHRDQTERASRPVWRQHGISLRTPRQEAGSRELEAVTAACLHPEMWRVESGTALV